jgi:hypothetical protein
MRLERVEYEFFDFENPSPIAAELARQIRLVFSDPPMLVPDRAVRSTAQDQSSVGSLPVKGVSGFGWRLPSP